MPLSDTLLVAIAGLVSTLFATVIGWVANLWSQRRHRDWQLEDERRRRRKEYLTKELLVIREYVDDLTTVLGDEWQDWLQVYEETIQSGSKLAAYREGLKKRAAEFESKWSGLQGNPWAHVRAVHDTELHRLVGKLNSLYWGQLTYALQKDQTQGREELFGVIQDVYKRLEELALD